MSLGTLRFGASALSPRLGEIRLDEVAHQAGSAETLDVLVATAAGTLRLVSVAYAEKWGGTSWRRELACQCCLGPARVLRVVDDWAVCRSCYPANTSHHLHKNATTWATEGAYVDALVRSLVKVRRFPGARRKEQRLARQLKKNVLARAMVELGNAERIIAAVDSIQGGDNA